MDSVQKSTITSRLCKLCHTRVQRADCDSALDANKSKSGQRVNLLRVCEQMQLGPASKGSITTSTQRARSQGLPLQLGYLLLYNASQHADSPQESMNRLKIPKNPVRAHTRKAKISIQHSKALLESVKMINNSQKENTTSCLSNYFGEQLLSKIAFINMLMKFPFSAVFHT